MKQHLHFRVAAGLGIMSMSYLFYRDQYRFESYGGSTSQIPESISMSLVPAEAAQLMKVHRREKFFSNTEIKQILAFEGENRHKLGLSRRDARGLKKINGSWTTYYLHTSGLFQATHKDFIEKIIDAAFEADKGEGWNIFKGNKGDIKVRVIELHTVLKNGALAEQKHNDFGSHVTIDVMCSSNDAFKGGEFCTLETDGNLKSYNFLKGDALIFPSHKYHCIQPVQEGERRVFVVELWEGEERTCAHRCTQHIGSCDYSLIRNRIDMLLTSAHPDIDPW